MQRALVTGAGARVGQAIALELGRAKMHVAVHYRSSADGAQQTCDAIAKAGGRAFAIAADLSDREAARDMLDAAVARLGGLDLLVLSAASFERIPLDEIDDDAFDRSLHLNTAAPFTLAHRARHALKQARGSIVFITGSSTQTPMRHYLPYVVSKAATRQLMRVLSLELAPEVRVNAIAPGTVLPPPDIGEAALKRITGRIPLGRTGSPDDIARAVLYLAGASFVTGQELFVDGGRSVAGFERYG